MRVIAYIRVSTDQQADEGVSLDVQRKKVEVYADLYDHEMVGLYEDAGASAKTLVRPGLQAALAALRRGEADALIVYKLDRLTRSVRDLHELLDTYFKSDFDLVSVEEQVNTQTATGRMVLGILIQVSQWEREVIGERTSAAMQHMQAQGLYTGGGIPYGYRVDGDALAEHPGEQRVVRTARELRGDGESYRTIARNLTGRGWTSRKGRAFSANQVRRMVA